MIVTGLQQRLSVCWLRVLSLIGQVGQDGDGRRIVWFSLCFCFLVFVILGLQLTEYCTVTMCVCTVSVCSVDVRGGGLAA